MAATIGRRIYRALFINSSVVLAAVILIMWLGQEDLEATLLALDFQENVQFLRQHNPAQAPKAWQTAHLTAFYLPDSAPAGEIPDIFQGVPVPFAGEIERGGKTYRVDARREDGGVYYLARDISSFERRESLFYLLLGGLALGATLLNFTLSIFASRRLVRPLRQLSAQIRWSAPGPDMARIHGAFPDRELAEIAAAVNQFIDEIESFVRRERMLLGLASHELRTPTAVIAGAVQVLENRGELNARDGRTLLRIKRAAGEMEENISSLLTLVRQTPQAKTGEAFALVPLLRQTIADMAASYPAIAERLQTEWRAPALNLPGDPTLVRILVRNLLANALQHTPGPVQLIQTEHHLDICDQGGGLPEAARQFLRGATERPEFAGLGLFIAKLVCEQLHWRLESLDGEAGSSVLRLWYAQRPT